LLATATFANESASGWQQVNFTTPVQVQANTTYIASYYTSVGFYSLNGGYFVNGVTNSPLSALSDAAASGNGVYRYGASSGFPTSTYQQSNYWVDVVYVGSIVDTTPPVVSLVTPAVNAVNVPLTATVSAQFGEALDPTTVNGATVILRNAAGATIAATVGYNAATFTAVLTPTAALAYSSQYTATVVGGATDPRLKDLAGNALVSNGVWSFTTAADPVPPVVSITAPAACHTASVRSSPSGTVISAEPA
jgi:hypothetical protein